ncbi:MAG: hypothetical protein J2P36_07675 [Ktedonobacteraceae bacterium]|nr:hypothetical protein [Ktedonobacteraceae bacterium]
MAASNPQPAEASTQTENKGAARVQAWNRSQRSQNLFMDALVALGCWGMAISFAFFTTDANRFLYAGMCVLMALIWSFRFGVRLRKSIQQSK